MEIIIALFLGTWLICASVLGYNIRLKNEFEPFTKEGSE